MNQLDTVKLTVAKLCHEMANHLSVITFIKEDLAGETDELDELSMRTDLLTYVMEFFRGMYSTSGTITDMTEVVLSIANFQRVRISDSANAMCKFSITKEANFFAGVLYIVLKICKPGDTITITESHRFTTVTIDTPRKLHSSICMAFNDETAVEDIFNIFALYVKKLASNQGFKLSTDLDEHEAARVNIWKA
jgi:glycyl-tRNA synthetase beta subunit